MYCSQCGKEVQREASFCAYCGTRQIAEPRAATPTSSSSPTAIRSTAPQMAQERAAAPLAMTPTQPQAVETQAAVVSTVPAGARRKRWVLAGASILILVLVGGIGFWGWTNKLANDETARRLAEASEASQRHAAEAAAADARRAAAEDVAERTEIASAQAALSKQIAEEESLAKTRAGMK
jgi:DNA-directed RNA polymerase subunit RPC12/RpoP